MQQGIIITRTPFRLSYFGGGTDFPDYFNEHGGLIIGAAVNKFLYVTINSLQRFYEKRIRLSYSKLELVDHLDELQHNIVKAVLNEHPLFDDNSFVDMHTYADLPGACGMGTSSAFTIGFLHALYLLNGVYRNPEQLAYEAIRIERTLLKEVGGWQDQIFAAYGGFNLIRFTEDRFYVEPIILANWKKEALEKASLLFFTGGTRSSHNIQQEVHKDPNENKMKSMHLIKELTATALQIVLYAKDENELVYEFGSLLDKTWEQKRSLSSQISNPMIDNMYARGKKAGAVGGKLCGAGGEGFLLLIVPQEKQLDVIQALSEYKSLNINFDHMGCQTIYSKLI
jgi:D-glycero-alpha-D-manno-heptose-7-phosphate kinase